MKSIFSPGEIISHYRLLHLIGVGGFGEVWQAEHADLASRVAIKIPTLAPYVKQLRAEGRIQFDLEHPNIVRILDLNTLHDPPYCVMEYIDGRNLRLRLREKSPLGTQEALDITRQVLLALHEAHGQGIVHRDLKPENVLLDFEGVARVTDFGLGMICEEMTRSIFLSTEASRLAAPPPSDAPISAMTGADSIHRSDSVDGEMKPSIIGTYDYMSPEQKAGKRTDARSDLYAVGVMLFEMLTGGRPSSNVEQMAQDQGWPAYLSEAILSALDEYDFRHASAADFLRALQLDAALTPAKARAGHSPLDQYLQTLNVHLKAIDEGGFLMGSNDGPEDERPSHLVEVPAFYLGVYPVTAMEFTLFLNETGERDDLLIGETRQATFDRVGNGFRPVKGAENHPANCVSYPAAVAFCEWLSDLSGQEFALPTEAQWEFAARCGSMANVYPWGEGKPTPNRACFGKTWAGARETLSFVDAFSPNEWGLFGMAGNVWEWCREPFLGDYAKTERQKITQGEWEETKRHPYYVVRGGCWSSPSEELRCARRNVQSKGARSAGIGFRVCRKP